MRQTSPSRRTRMIQSVGIAPSKLPVLVEQESSTYTYLLADAETKEVRDSAGPPPAAGVTAQ